MELDMEILKKFLGCKDGLMKKNLIFSPLSINILMSMVANTLKEGPELEKWLSLLGSKTIADLNANYTSDIQQLTDYCNTDEGHPKFSLVNSYWIDKKFKLDPSCELLLSTVYKSKVSNHLDFKNKGREAIYEINSWAEENTKGLIKNLLKYNPDTTKLTIAILANALYFKGVWLDQFDPSRTLIEKFYTLNGDVIQVPYMTHNFSLSGCYAPFDEFNVLQLPYDNPSYGKGLTFAMYIFLPKENDGLLNLMSLFGSNPKDFLTQKFKFNPIYYIGKLRIPKFNFNYKFEVSKTMKELGLSMNAQAKLLPFSDETVKKVYHSACIEVNENGTEASAVTYEDDNCGCCMYSPPKKYVDFVADHPFFFMIREENSRRPIFFGVVVNPLLAK
ncbi:serpin-Z10-like [Cannabis sativa]|uniref:serpin-Z10-like n=1 Tax=Cannabis sativa TaxID=3483 RepID=UPI0011DF0B92|nr:serpin-Z10-like [Cannabis sativa]